MKYKDFNLSTVIDENLDYFKVSQYIKRILSLANFKELNNSFKIFNNEFSIDKNYNLFLKLNERIFVEKELKIEGKSYNAIYSFEKYNSLSLIEIYNLTELILHGIGIEFYTEAKADIYSELKDISTSKITKVESSNLFSTYFRINNISLKLCECKIIENSLSFYFNLDEIVLALNMLDKIITKRPKLAVNYIDNNIDKEGLLFINNLRIRGISTDYNKTVPSVFNLISNKNNVIIINNETLEEININKEEAFKYITAYINRNSHCKSCNKEDK